MDEVKMLETIYSGTREEVIEAINEKRLWIENIFYVPGNIDLVIGDDGLEHYPFIEALYNGTFLFSKVDFSDPNFTAEECELVDKTSSDLAVFNVFDDIDLHLDTFFWVQYDFSLMDLSMYHDLVANLYHRLPYKTLNINKTHIADKGVDLMKSLIIGKSGESVLIISQDKLINMCYYCPVIKKIFYKANCPNDLLASLKEIALKNHLEIEVINEN